MPRTDLGVKTLMKTISCVAAAVLVAIAAEGTASAREAIASVKFEGHVRIEKRIVHSAAIGRNLLGTTADREVFVALPPGYDRNANKRYPVVYALHGFSTDASKWIEQLRAKAALEGAFASGTPEMIVVFPDGSNEYGGSFYGQSQVTGDFETFVAEEVPDFIDRTYRTIAEPASRGLMGHSMGGYGVARIGMKRPGRFGALYMMSPCCLLPLGVQGLTETEVREINALPSPRAAAGLPFKYSGPLATSAAFSPNPVKAPLYVDLPVDDKGGVRTDIMAKRAANAPLSFMDQYVVALRTYRAIGIDVGDQDSIVAAATLLHKNLDNYAIENRLEIYLGDHSSQVPTRLRDVVIPFFGRNLSMKHD